MSPPRVRGTGVVHSSSRVTAAGTWNRASDDPWRPPGWELTYQVPVPRVVIRSSSALTVVEPESDACPNHAQDGCPWPGFTHGRPRVMAWLIASSGCPDGQVPE